MKQVNEILWNEPSRQQFAEALLSIDSRSTLQKFLSDVMTEKEITEISARLEAARLLSQNVSYTQIATATKLSSRTIARISEWMKNGTGGYEAVLAHHLHTSPAYVE